MKLVASIIASTAMADHYRGGAFQVAQSSNGKLTLTNTQTWKRGGGRDMYTNKCRTTASSSQSLGGYCQGVSCTDASDADMTYTALFVGDDYCYGDGTNEIVKPSGAFRWGWEDCCWVNTTTDFGKIIKKGSINLVMEIQDVNNNTPRFKLPPLWMIMAGCPSQTIDLAPTDPDGDSVRCRWATSLEAGGAYTTPSDFPSLTLDTANCIVKYDGTKDSTSSGVKPIGIMMEDVDSNGKVRSTTPVQFLAQVWTPSMNARAAKVTYPDWFGEHDESDDHIDSDTSSRGRRAAPAYCSAVPEFVAPTPADGHNIITNGAVSVTLAASSKNGSITKFSYQAPSGMSCTSVNSNGRISCSWTLSAAQMEAGTHSFCYDATDNLGLLTSRRCLTIMPKLNGIIKVSQMAAKVLDGTGNNGFWAADGHNYGCAGRGTYEAFTGTLGSAVDDNDRAFYIWKKCVQCATDNDGTAIPAYDFDDLNMSCANSSNPSRGVCECDKALVVALYHAKPGKSNFDTSKCVASGGGANTDCCNWNTFMYARFNTDTHECCTNGNGVRETGSC